MVSVVIPAYNAERFILDALQSVKEQTHRPVEVIVVNDGSTDRTAEIVTGFVSKAGDDSFEIRLVDVTPNKGVANALHTGFSKASGNYMCWLSADDAYIDRTKLSLQLERMRSEGAMWSYYRGTMSGSSVAEARPVRSTFPLGIPFVRAAFEKNPLKRLAMLFLRNPINGSSVMISRECVQKYGQFDPSRRNMDHDGDLWLRYSALGARLTVLDGAPVFYRRHEGQDSKRLGMHVYDVELTQMRLLKSLERSGKLSQAIDAAYRLMPVMMRPDVYKYRPVTVDSLFRHVVTHREQFSGWKSWYGHRVLKKLAAATDVVPVNKDKLLRDVEEYSKSDMFMDFERKLRPG
ncbi:MAG TPA: glycosyltransferase [Thermoplasmata archaeon]